MLTHSRDGQPAQTQTVKYRRDYRPPDFLVDNVHLHFNLGAEKTRVVATSQLKRNPAAPANANQAKLWLDGKDMTLIDIKCDGKTLHPGQDFTLTALGMQFLRELPNPCELSITTEFSPKANTELEGLYHSGTMLCTQCEAEGFRKITYFIDRPDMLARYRVTMEGDKNDYPVLLANGNPVSHQDLPDGRHQAVWEDPFPKPCYLFALVAGQLGFIQDHFVTKSGRKVDLRIYAVEKDLPRCDHAMNSLKKAMKWDEDVYGLEYDLDLFMIVAVSDFNMGAMENKGLNIFNTKYVLVDQETATDSDYLNVESVIAHEYFHNWTGDRVTCRDWFQLSLKEGLTVFRDQKFSEDMGSAALKRIADVRVLRASQFPEDSGPHAHPIRPDSYIEINNFYTATVYNKGAEIIRMMHRILGAQGFRRGMDLYFARHDGQAVTCDDFVAAMEDANKPQSDLTQFRRWYSQSGTPHLTITRHYDAQTGLVELTVAQITKPTLTQAEKHPLHIPLALAWFDANGKKLALSCDQMPAKEIAQATTQEITQATTQAQNQGEIILPITRPSEKFVFRGAAGATGATGAAGAAGAGQPIPSLLRGFSAPVSLQDDLSHDERLVILRYDDDAVTRWDAAQIFATTELNHLITHYDREKLRNYQIPEGFVAALRTALGDDTDPELLSLLLIPPSETVLIEGLSAANPDHIHQVRQAWRAKLGIELASELSRKYQALTKFLDEAPPDATRAAPSTPKMAARSLRNAILGIVAAAHRAQADALAMHQYRHATTMTDRIAALAVICDGDASERTAILSDFAEKFRDNELVMDKWFAVQAMASRPATLSEVERLMTHPQFNLKNPNRARSLLASFAFANLWCFHAEDGSGYAFLRQQVATIDHFNPRLAARLVEPLTQWRRFEATRQNLMQAQLAELLARPDLSQDVSEIVTAAA
ncbi:MAG: aminopeptidase N [Candidatus Symbiobacter sp.]|nr:aminopeptidase N [Candidatus Symbiobacter sp.]